MPVKDCIHNLDESLVFMAFEHGYSFRATQNALIFAVSFERLKYNLLLDRDIEDILYPR